MNTLYFKDKVLPRHMSIALGLIGTKEIVGSRHSDIILGWAKYLGLDKIYTNDELAWCGLFFAYVMKLAGREVILQGKDPYDYLRALKYQRMPNVIEILKGEEKVGDILIFQRPEGGHIAFNAGEGKDTFVCLGGNQGNTVSLTNIAKSRLVKCLRPNYNTYKPFLIVVNNTGPVSTNEA